jgi:hypothetical protein
LEEGPPTGAPIIIFHFENIFSPLQQKNFFFFHQIQPNSNGYLIDPPTTNFFKTRSENKTQVISLS